MTTVRFFTILLVSGTILVSGTTLTAETILAAAEPAEPVKVRTISEYILEWAAVTCAEAGVPLSFEQADKIRALRFTGDFRAPLLRILTGSQAEALKIDARENIVPILAAYLGKAGCPLSGGQIDSLRALDPTTAGIGEAASILTKQQAVSIHRLFPGELSEWTIKGLSSRLERAGIPLSPEQISRIRAISPETASPDSLSGILTREQLLALRKGFGDSPAGEALLQGFVRFLEASGCPLSPEQKAQLRDLPSGKESLLSILTPEQKKAIRFPAETE